MIDADAIRPFLAQALDARIPLLDERHETAVRLFNGFREGCPQLVVELFGATAVLYNYADPPAELDEVLTAVTPLLREQFPWLQAILVKTRHGSEAEKRGALRWGGPLTSKIREHGVRYALELTLHQDASFYLDTQNVRRWALDHLAGKAVLNTFAYTGSLGVAAAAAGASRVLQTDLNKRFLNVAKTSYTLNGLVIGKKLFQAEDSNQLTGAGRRTADTGRRLQCNGIQVLLGGG